VKYNNNHCRQGTNTVMLGKDFPTYSISLACSPARPLSRTLPDCRVSAHCITPQKERSTCRLASLCALIATRKGGLTGDCHVDCVTGSSLYGVECVEVRQARRQMNGCYNENLSMCACAALIGRCRARYRYTALQYARHTHTLSQPK
jgi:hypothetical protein